jgi:U3 small nucleolar RNA-associated protein 22
MAPLPSKRRQLDHPDLESGSTDLSRTLDDDEGNMQHSFQENESSAKNAPKQPNRRPTQAQNTNESALYAGGMYKSSMFKLQVDEMLAEAQSSYEKRMGWVDEALHRLHAVIGAIEECEPLPVGLPLMI